MSLIRLVSSPLLIVDCTMFQQSCRSCFRRQKASRWFSTGSSLEPAASAMEKFPLGNVVRHGSGDGVIVLNVGGKEFKTLRSTVASNSVLAQHVARAEANKEFTSGGSAVFIDREPTNFGIILQYLRNRLDNVTIASPYKQRIAVVAINKLKHESTKIYAEKYVQLPQDVKVLKALFGEACHYDIVELQDALCRQNFIVNIVSGFGGNPFDTLSTITTTARRGLIMLGGFGTMFFGTQAVKDDENGKEKSWKVEELAKTAKNLVNEAGKA